MKRESEFRYTTLANVLREQILSGYIKPGQYLLSENELCRHYSLSRSSVRKALDQLLEEGLISKRVGQGTIVSTDLSLPQAEHKTLRILATSPSFFADYGMPIIQEAFKSAYPDVDVKVLSIPSGSFRDMFETSREMGFQPDLLFVTDKQYKEFSMESSSTFLPLQQMLKSELDSMYPRLVQAFGGAQTVLGVPVSFSPVYLIYNPQMFERFGAQQPYSSWTKQDFLSAAKMLTRDTDGDGIPDTCGISLPTALNRWPSIAMRNGYRFNPEDDPDCLLRSLTFLHDMLYRYRVATLASHTWLNSEAFLREKTGMVLTTSFELANWRRTGLPFEPKIAPMPFGPDPSSQLIANVFMIPDTCEDLGLASQFLKMALSPETQKEIGKAASFLSVLPPVNESLLEPDDLNALGLTGNSLDNCYFIYEMLPDVEIMGEIEKQMDLFWTGLESAEAFGSRLKDIIQQK